MLECVHCCRLPPVLAAVDATSPVSLCGRRLEHVSGYTCSMTRHSVMYASDGRVVYPAGACVVVHDLDNHRQSLLVHPSDGICDVTCVAMHPGGDLVAIGTAGLVPSCSVWSASTATLRARLPDFYLRAVTNVSFDPVGEMLATVGLDDAYTIAVFDWAAGGRMIATSPGAHRAFVCGFSIANQALIVGGIEHLTFWTLAGATLAPAEADYGPWRPLQGEPEVTVTALGFHPDGGAVTGSGVGGLFRWRAGSNRCMWSNSRAHRGAVHDITFTGDAIASGGADGRIVLWSPADMRRVHVIDMREVASSQLDGCGRPTCGPLGKAPCIRSLCSDSKTTRMLVGASSGHVWEIDLAQQGTWRDAAGGGCQLLFSCHGSGMRQSGAMQVPPPRAYALAAHPCELACATVGDDGTLCFWDCSTRVLRMRRPLPAPGCSVAFTPDDGALVAVGLMDGRVLVLDARSGMSVAAAQYRHAPLCVLSFSPCGRWLLSGCDDGGIDVYDVAFGFVRVGSSPMGGTEESPVEHADWSADSRYLRTNTAHGALLYWEAPGCDSVRFAAAMRDTQWASHTCPLSWATQGLWPSGGTEQDVPACALSHARDVVAAITPDGRVCLYRFPCDVGRAACTERAGHGYSTASAVAWTFNDQYLLTFNGGGDRCLMQWRHIAPGQMPGGPPEIVTSDVEEDAMMPPSYGRLASSLTCTLAPCAPARMEGYVGGVPRLAPLHWLARGHMEGSSGVQVPTSTAPGSQPARGLDPGTGAAFTPAWNDIHPPDGYVRELDALAPPPEALRLLFCFGHSSGGRNSVHPCANARGVIAHCARVAYVYERDAHVMHFCADDPAASDVAAAESRGRGHADAILCCASHPSASLFATGEAGAAPRILVWSSLAPGEGPVARMPRGSLRHGVSALTFSRDGTLLAAADCSRGHVRVALFQWANATLIAMSPSTAQRVLELRWSPFQEYFVTVGLRHCAFWAPQPLRCKPADFTAAAAPGGVITPGLAQSCLCIAFPAADMTVVGTQDGSLCLFRGASLVTCERNAHLVTHALLARRDALLSAGKEGTLKFWAPDLSACLRTLELSHPLAYGACIKSLAPVTGAAAVLAATRSGEVYSVDIATGSALLLLQGHGPGGIAGMCAHPQLARFASCGGDGTLRLWDAIARRPLLSRVLAMQQAHSTRPGSLMSRRPLPLCCVAWHPSGTLLAAGASDGALFLVNALALEIVHSRCDRPSVALTSAAFSPCGRFLVVGDADGVLTCYDIDIEATVASTGSVARTGQARGHVCDITAMDWSHDSVLLQTNGADGTLCFWDMPSLARCAASADARNADWSTHTCTVTWATQGILPSLTGATPPVTCCDRAHARTCIAVGDAHGIVSMYQFPTHAGARRRLFGGHSSAVTAARFLVDDTHLVTASHDGSLFLWDVRL